MTNKQRPEWNSAPEHSVTNGAMIQWEREYDAISLSRNVAIVMWKMCKFSIKWEEFQHEKNAQTLSSTENLINFEWHA